jgi:hypothetical protein
MGETEENSLNMSLGEITYPYVYFHSSHTTSQCLIILACCVNVVLGKFTQTLSRHSVSLSVVVEQEVETEFISGWRKTEVELEVSYIPVPCVGFNQVSAGSVD